MNFGSNLQHLRSIHKNMTQEELASKLGVSRQTISKWELNQGNPELDKLEEICKFFNCKADELLFNDIRIANDSCSEIQIETVNEFEYIKYSVISPEPEEDAMRKVLLLAKYLNINEPKLIGWDFPYLSQEQINVFHFHGYTSALVLPAGFKVPNKSFSVEKRKTQKYLTIEIKDPMSNPFHLISGAYKSISQYMNINRYESSKFCFEHVFSKDGIECMKIYVGIES